MKRGPLTADELPHLEHRWAVISSFLDVASDANYIHAAGYTAGWRVYDRYLKANRVEDGAASYARVVRLALGTELGRRVTAQQER